MRFYWWNSSSHSTLQIIALKISKLTLSGTPVCGYSWARTSTFMSLSNFCPPWCVSQNHELWANGTKRMIWDVYKSLIHQISAVFIFPLASKLVDLGMIVICIVLKKIKEKKKIVICTIALLFLPLQSPFSEKIWYVFSEKRCFLVVILTISVVLVIMRCKHLHPWSKSASYHIHTIFQAVKSYFSFLRSSSFAHPSKCLQSVTLTSPKFWQIYKDLLHNCYKL